MGMLKRNQIPNYVRPSSSGDGWRQMLTQRCVTPAVKLDYRNVSSLFDNPLYHNCSTAQVFAMGAVLIEDEVQLHVTLGTFACRHGDVPFSSCCACFVEVCRLHELQVASTNKDVYASLTAFRKDQDSSSIRKIRPQHAPCCQACLVYTSWMVRHAQKERKRKLVRQAKLAKMTNVRI